MKARRKVIVHDDEPTNSKGWARKIQTMVGNDFEVAALTNDQFGEALKSLDERRSLARSGKKKRSETNVNVIDTASIFVIDYDLLKSSHKSFLTGEAFAYLSRCYSTCGLIIVVNQFGGDVFDLTLAGHPESFADLNVGARQLLCEGLWRQPWKGFRSWHWPLIPEFLDSFDQRINSLKKNLDEPIIEFLNLQSIYGSLSGPAAEFLQGNIKKELTKITFRQFVEKNATKGLRNKDKPLGDQYTARIAASRVGKWLERVVLVGQDILVDAPHLVARFPSLLTGDRSKLSSWNRTTELGPRSPGGVHTKVIEKFRFRREEWLSRPTWYWSQVSACTAIQEVSNPFGRKISTPNFVFCEDVSRFLPSSKAREFVADLPSPFVRRFVAIQSGPNFSKLRDFTYAPEVRFAIG